MTGSVDENHNRLNEVYAGLQEQLRAGLASSRSVIDHPGAKGSGTEANWLKMLQDHLPHRYQVETAFVVDAEGQQSEQIDIVIYDRQYTPELYNVAGQKLIPSEGVYAVLEVKQTLDKGNVEYAGGKISSVRRLNRTSVEVVHAGGEYAPRPNPPILGGILATQSEWNPPLGEAFHNCLAERPEEEKLNFGCVLDAGGFEVSYDGDELKTQISSREHALAFFFLRLLRSLQRIGTVPALDYDAYLAAFCLD
ncbi:DUF6602 domain-containing protein [Elongatibacter sediminis]|uniref:DUF6602 domain-containing protein n=1 Tax=Elongatibacter sediminis TaxID=3119006 RepID=A0AAW9RMT2_9GAMM